MKFENVQVSESNYPDGDIRRVDVGRMNVWDFASSKRGFKSREINVHGIDLSTMKQRTKTFGSGANKFKVKIICFTDEDGVSHEIALYAKRGGSI